MSFHSERIELSRTGYADIRAIARRTLSGMKRFAVSLTRRKAIEDLGRLDDRMLADVGLTRSDLRAAREWSLWGDPTDRLASLADERRTARRAMLRERAGRTLRS